MSQITFYVLEGALALMVLFLIPCLVRLLIGPTPADRLQAIDTITALLIGIVILLGLVQRSALVIDIGIALAAFGFIAVLALARFLAEGRMF